MSSRFNVETIFRAVDRVSGPLTRMTTRVNRFSASAERGFTRVNSGLARAQNNLNASARAGAGVALAAGVALQKVTDVGANFEQTMVNAAAKYPGLIRQGSDAFDELANKAREVGSTTEFSATQAAQALEFLAMAGFNADQSISALPQIVDFATASTLDLATASDIASDALGQFNMATEDTEQQAANLDRIMNVMSKTSLTANASVGQLFETFRTAGPVATAAGASIETVSALTGTLANASIKGEKAGTALRAVFGRLQAPAGEAAKVLRRLGIATRDADGNMLDVVDVLGSMDKALTGFGSAQKAEVLKSVFGEEPIAAVNVLLNAGTKNLKEYRTQLEGTAGTTKTLASTMRNTTRGDINGMSSAIEGLTVTFFDLNRLGIREGLSGVTEWVRALDTMLQSNEELAKQIGVDGAAAFVALGKSILSLIAIMTALRLISVAVSIAIVAVRVASISATASTWAWGAAVAAATSVLKFARVAVLAFSLALAVNPIGLVVAAIGTLIAAGVALYTYWDEVSGFFGTMWDGLKTAFTAGVDAVTMVLTPFIDLIRSVSSIWDTLRGTVSEPINAEINTKQNVVNENGRPGRGVVAAGAGVSSPQQAIAHSINENRSSTDITLRNNTDTKAEVAAKTGRTNMVILNSGNF